jgi:hypothetical protein
MTAPLGGRGLEVVAQPAQELGGWSSRLLAAPQGSHEQEVARWPAQVLGAVGPVSAASAPAGHRGSTEVTT